MHTKEFDNTAKVVQKLMINLIFKLKKVLLENIIKTLKLRGRFRNHRERTALDMSEHFKFTFLKTIRLGKEAEKFPSHADKSKYSIQL